MCVCVCVCVRESERERETETETETQREAVTQLFHSFVVFTIYLLNLNFQPTRSRVVTNTDRVLLPYLLPYFVDGFPPGTRVQEVWRSGAACLYRINPISVLYALGIRVMNAGCHWVWFRLNWTAA